MSGHIFFKERWFGFDDGTYAGARLLEILSRYDDPSAVLDALADQLLDPRAQRAVRRGRAARAGGPARRTRRFRRRRRRSRPSTALRVDWPDGFGLIRASNTTPVLVLRFEGHTQEALDRIEAQMLALLRSVKPDAKIAEAAH